MNNILVEKPLQENFIQGQVSIYQILSAVWETTLSSWISQQHSKVPISKISRRILGILTAHIHRNGAQLGGQRQPRYSFVALLGIAQFVSA